MVVAMSAQISKKVRKLFLIFIFLPAMLSGCAPAFYVAGNLATTEVLGSKALSDVKVTGAELRQGADFSYAYAKHVDLKLALEHNDWTCYRGKGKYLGEELCLVPSEAEGFSNRSWFECRHGRGGKIVRLSTGDKSLYCQMKEEQVSER